MRVNTSWRRGTISTVGTALLICLHTTHSANAQVLHANQVPAAVQRGYAEHGENKCLSHDSSFSIRVLM